MAVVPLLRGDTVLATQPNGDPQIYWSGSMTYEAFTGSSALVLVLYALVLTNAKYRIRGQFSVDGRTWAAVETDSGYIDGLTAASGDLGVYSYQWVTKVITMSAMFRIGLELSSADGTHQGFAQINLNATGLTEAQPTSIRILNGDNVASSGSPNPIGNPIACQPFKACRATLKLTAASADTLTLILKTGESGALVSAATGTLVSGGTEVSVELSTPASYVQAFYLTGGSWSTRVAPLDLMLRPN